LLQARSKINLDAEMAKVERAGAWLLTLADDAYPPLLKSLPDAPAVLYIRGTLLPGDEQALGVVGTRKATTYGRDVAHGLSKQLAGNDITIVSGLAHGIDTAAHRGALDGGGRTIAVMGCGIDQIYPRDNRSLASEISQRGALITEFAIGVPPEARNFPRRNRVISGLSLGVLVIEAPEDSGALITAEIAAEQGREVFAVPGNIYSLSSRGANRLIQDGAKLVMDVEDILSELHIARTNIQVKTSTERVAPANDLESQVLKNLSADPLHVDDLARLCGLPIATITATLTILELKGLAQNVGSMQPLHYFKTSKP
jgi:DNA processing protein